MLSVQLDHSIERDSRSESAGNNCARARASDEVKAGADVECGYAVALSKGGRHAGQVGRGICPAHTPAVQAENAKWRQICHSKPLLAAHRSVRAACLHESKTWFAATAVCVILYLGATPLWVRT